MRNLFLHRRLAIFEAINIAFVITVKVSEPFPRAITDISGIDQN